MATAVSHSNVSEGDGRLWCALGAAEEGRRRKAALPQAADLLIFDRPRPQVPIEKTARACLRAIWVPPHRAAAQAGDKLWGRLREVAPLGTNCEDAQPLQRPCGTPLAETVLRVDRIPAHSWRNVGNAVEYWRS